jgi:hypothetical protein
LVSPFFFYTHYHAGFCPHRSCCYFLAASVSGDSRKPRGLESYALHARQFSLHLSSYASHTFKGSADAAALVSQVHVPFNRPDNCQNNAHSFHTLSFFVIFCPHLLPVPDRNLSCAEAARVFTSAQYTIGRRKVDNVAPDPEDNIEHTVLKRDALRTRTTTDVAWVATGHTRQLFPAPTVSVPAVTRIVIADNPVIRAIREKGRRCYKQPEKQTGYHQQQCCSPHDKPPFVFFGAHSLPAAREIPPSAREVSYCSAFCLYRTSFQEIVNKFQETQRKLMRTPQLKVDIYSR